MEGTSNRKFRAALFKRLFWVVVSLGFVVWIILTLFAFDVNLPFETSMAHAQWDRANISSYEIHYMVNFTNLYVTVENGEITRLEYTPLTFDDDPPRTPTTILPDWYPSASANLPFLPPDLSHYTVDGLFAYWEQFESQAALPLIRMCSTDWDYSVSFDHEWGYIKRLAYSNCGIGYEFGMGLSCSYYDLCDGGIRIRVLDFTVLSDTNE